jgi:hypothetical protein
MIGRPLTRDFVHDNAEVLLAFVAATCPRCSRAIGEATVGVDPSRGARINLRLVDGGREEDHSLRFYHREAYSTMATRNCGASRLWTALDRIGVGWEMVVVSAHFQAGS